MSVRPFRHPKYDDNKQRCREGEDPCVMCGKPVKYNDRIKWVLVVDGGSRFGNPHENVDPAGDMGFFPVGPGCWRKHRQELQAFTVLQQEDHDTDGETNCDGKENQAPGVCR